MKLVLFAGALTSIVYAETKVFDPSAIQESNSLAFSIDVLCWQASQDGLGFVIDNKGSTSTITNGQLKSPDFDWNWGFRAAVDWKIPHDQWDLRTLYTYLPSTAERKVSASPGGALFPSWQYTAGNFATYSKAHWKCNLNIGDLELGRTCFVGTWLSMRPFVGVRGAVIDQRYHIQYQGGTAAPTGDVDKVKMSNDFWGVGLRFGVNSLWGLGRGWSFYADGAGSLLSGGIKVREYEYFNVANQTILSVKDDISTVTADVEIALGLQWDILWDHDRYHLGVKVGWELGCFFDQNRFAKFSNSTNPGFYKQNNDDLSFQGVTVGLRFDF